MKNQYRTKDLPGPTSIREAASKIYVDKKLIVSSTIEIAANIEMNDKNITTARFIQVNQLLQIYSHLTAKL